MKYSCTDGTLILNTGKLTVGIKLTHKLAVKKDKPVFIVQYTFLVTVDK